MSDSLAQPAVEILTATGTEVEPTAITDAVNVLATKTLDVLATKTLDALAKLLVEAPETVAGILSSLPKTTLETLGETLVAAGDAYPLALTLEVRKAYGSRLPQPSNGASAPTDNQVPAGVTPQDSRVLVRPVAVVSAIVTPTFAAMFNPQAGGFVKADPAQFADFKEVGPFIVNGDTKPELYAEFDFQTALALLMSGICIQCEDGVLTYFGGNAFTEPTILIAPTKAGWHNVPHNPMRESSAVWYPTIHDIVTAKYSIAKPKLPVTPELVETAAPVAQAACSAE